MSKKLSTTCLTLQILSIIGLCSPVVSIADTATLQNSTPTSRLVTLRKGSFAATASNGAVIIVWETVAEINNAGFFIWRAQLKPDKTACSLNGADYTEVKPITTTLLPSQAEFSLGALYSYPDSQVGSGTTYCYALEDVDLNGTRTFNLDDIVSATVTFTATVNEGVVNLEWNFLSDNAGFIVWRGQLKDGKTACSLNGEDYTEVKPISTLPAKTSTQTSSYQDNQVNSGNTYCYAIEELELEGASTFHLDNLVSATVN